MKQLLKKGLLLVAFVLQFSTVVYAGDMSEGTVKHESEMVEDTVLIEQQDTEQELGLEQELEAEQETETKTEQETETDQEQMVLPRWWKPEISWIDGVRW